MVKCFDSKTGQYTHQKIKMQPLGENGTNIPAFLGKLWKMVNDPSTDHLICWSPAGNSFVIQNQAQFWYELLPLYYKHNNMSSFVRQLNMYGFHKMSTVENGSMDADKDEIQFYHPFFQRDQPELLRNIKRKVSVTGTKTHDNINLRSDELTKVLMDVKQLRGRQSNVDSQLSAMKQENAVLWRELAMLRQKHIKQQQIVNKLIQFLVTLVQPSASARMGVGVKRRIPLMLHESLNKKVKVRKPNLNNKDGPTIHELDNEIEITPEDIFEEDVEEIPIINSPLTPKTTCSSASSTSSIHTQTNNVKSPLPSALVDEASQDALNPENPEFLWDEPEFVDINQPEEGLSDTETPEETLIERLKNNAQANERVFLNPQSRDTLLSNLIGNGSYNLAGLTGKNTNTSRKQSNNNLSANGIPLSPQQNADMIVATRDNNLKINNGTIGTNEYFRDDLDIHLDHTQNEIDQLKDILNSCNTFDANALLGLFTDAPDYGLPNFQNKDGGTSETGDPMVSGNELAPCTSNNLIDFNELLDSSLQGQDDAVNSDSILLSPSNLLSPQTLDTPLIVKNEPIFPGSC